MVGAVKRTERTELEKELKEDFLDMPVARTARLDELVEKYLLYRAGLLTERQVRGEKDILKLINLHARVALLERVIKHAEHFNLKEMKELFRSTLIVEANDAAENARADLTHQLAQIATDNGAVERIKGMLAEKARDSLRREIEAGKVVVSEAVDVTDE